MFFQKLLDYIYFYWNNLEPATLKFCEHNLDAWIAQPTNAWSNVAYVLIGLWLLWKYQKEDNGSVIRFLPIIAILIGTSSFFYHASNTFFFQVFDLSFMFLLSAFLLSINLKRLFNLKWNKFYILYGIFFFFSLIILLIMKKKVGEILFGIEILGAFLLEILLVKKKDIVSYKNLIFAVLVLIIAFTFWTLDYIGIFCDPHNHIIQGHAIWHVVSSLGFIYIYKHYRRIAKK